MEKDLKTILGGAEEISQKAAEEAKSAHELARAEIKGMQQKILAGEGGTGNPLHDGIIAIYGEYTNDTLVKNYEEVADRLKAVDIYEPVVTIRRWLENAEHIAFPSYGHRPRQHLETRLSMGTLKSKDILFDYTARKSYLSTAQVVHTPGWRQNAAARSGNLLLDGGMSALEHSANLGYDLGREIDMNVPMFEHYITDSGIPVIAMELLIGYDNIRNWLAEPGEASFDRDQEFLTMLKFCKLLQIKPIEPGTRWQKRAAQKPGI